MSGLPRRHAGRGRAAPASASGPVVPLEAVRIERALAQRARYHYVRPRIVPEGRGWKIVSPNCSRNIDADGGEIDIAWFEPGTGHRWTLHARDHAAGAWRETASGLALEAALAQVCADPDRVYWP